MKKLMILIALITTFFIAFVSAAESDSLEFSWVKPTPPFKAGACIENQDDQLFKFLTQF